MKWDMGPPVSYDQPPKPQLEKQTPKALPEEKDKPGQHISGYRPKEQLQSSSEPKSPPEAKTQPIREQPHRPNSKLEIPTPEKQASPPKNKEPTVTAQSPSLPPHHHIKYESCVSF